MLNVARALALVGKPLSNRTLAVLITSALDVVSGTLRLKSIVVVDLWHEPLTETLKVLAGG
jgi:hypothetical protein